MDEFFAGDYSGSAFEFLGTAHLGALAFLVLFNLFLGARAGKGAVSPRGIAFWRGNPSTRGSSPRAG
mgnify:CR=1 FL=1